MSYRPTEWPHLVHSNPVEALRLVRQAMREHGRQADAARALGISRRTLCRVLERLRGA